MNQATTDTWYVRFPDGRVARAARARPSCAATQRRPHPERQHGRRNP